MYIHTYIHTDRHTDIINKQSEQPTNSVRIWIFRKTMKRFVSELSTGSIPVDVVDVDERAVRVASRPEGNVVFVITRPLQFNCHVKSPLRHVNLYVSSTTPSPSGRRRSLTAHFNTSLARKNKGRRILIKNGFIHSLNVQSHSVTPKLVILISKTKSINR